jgi:Right handed beta helix region
LYYNGPGIVLSGEGHKVKNAVVYFNGTGIVCSSGGRGSSVEHSRVYHNDTDGIDMAACPGSSIIGNTVFANAGMGIYAQCPSVILQNMVYDNGGLEPIHVEGPGIYLCTRADNNPGP